MPESEVDKKIPKFLTFEELLTQLKEVLAPVAHPHFKELEDADALAAKWPKDTKIESAVNKKRTRLNGVSPKIVWLRDKMDKEDKDDYKKLRELREVIEKEIKKEPTFKLELVPEGVEAHFVDIKKSIESRDSIAKIKEEIREILEVKKLSKMMKEEKSSSSNKRMPIMQKLKQRFGGPKENVR